MHFPNFTLVNYSHKLMQTLHEYFTGWYESLCATVVTYRSKIRFPLSCNYLSSVEEASKDKHASLLSCSKRFCSTALRKLCFTIASDSGTVVEGSPHIPKVEGLSLATTAGTRAQCYETFYCGNLSPFHGHTIILCYKAKLS